MEQFVLSIFQEQLSKFIIGFRKEQVNANLLNGKGEIRDVEINCAVLNDDLRKMTPFIELESVHVSKLSFHVSSWTNIRKAPILVHVEHLTATVKEPLDYVDREKQRSIRQITRGEFVEMLRTGMVKARGAYNLFDRILDNLTVEIASINVNLQPWGRFKTRRPGPWTPPEIQLAFAGIRLVSVNEFGQEAPPEEVWRHNHHRSSSGSLLIYKKLSMEYKISIKPFNSAEPIPLVTGRDNKMEIQLAMKRRIRDGEWLAVQIDTTIPQVEADLSQEVIPHLVNALAGVSYCITKDRSFEDPLKAATDMEHDDHHDSVHGPVVASSENILEENEEEDIDPSEVPVEIEEDESSSSSEDEQGLNASQDQAPSTELSKTNAATGRYSMPNDVQSQPIILLPNGLTISEKLSLSMAVYDFKLKGSYVDNGHFELISKGCIGEAIWPKTSREKGGYVQASVSYLTLQEKHDERLCTLISGGVKYDSSLPLETPGKPLAERGNDETFPLYEDRVIRPDPLGLRYSFPSQAIGLKSTIEFVQKLTKDSSGEDEDIRVIHESGIDDFDIVLDSGPWSRIVRFLANEAAGGFDPRWSSGDWSKELAPSMLVRPSQRLNLEDCLQPTKQIFLDENQFISSDLFNVTCRLTKVGMRIPATIQESLTASAFVFKMDEGMLVVSSALPRTMLSGRIGNSINGDDIETKGMINFPNDTSDVAYQLERSEDPGDRQRGILTSRAISTFRLQFTARGASAKIIPTVEFYSAKEPRELLAPTDVTMIFCFEGEPPESEESNLTKIVVFTSLLAHKVSCNFDVELVASVIISLMSHYHVFGDCVRSITATLAESFVDESETEASLHEDEAGRLPRSIRGRRLRVRRQLMHSRETGGLNIAVGMQVAEVSLNVWRQCVPTISSLRPPKQAGSPRVRYVPLLKLAEVVAGGFEIGVEASFKKDNRRIVLKGCLSRVGATVCDIRRAIEECMNMTSSEASGDGAKKEGTADHLLELFSVGEERYCTPSHPLEYTVGFRVEEVSREFCSWSLSLDVCGTCRLTFRPEELESIATLLFEALMQPSTLSLSKEMDDEDDPSVFPRNTVGALLVSLLPWNVLPSDGWSISETLASLSTAKGPIPARSLDAFLKKLVVMFPQRVRTVLVYTSLRDFGMFVPSDSKPRSEEEPGFCLVIHSLDFLAQYLHMGSGMTDSPLLDVTACRDKTWNDFVKTKTNGLFHEMKSEQSLSVAWEDLGQGGIVVTGDVVVPQFSTGYSYADSRVIMEMPSGIAVDVVEHLDRFVFCMLDFRDRCLRTVVSMSNILKTLRVSPQLQENESAASKNRANPIALACLRTSSTLQSGLELFDAISSYLKQYDEQVTLLLKEKEEIADKARLVAFMREKEKVAAYALVESQKTGWLCIGAASKTGQRSTITSSLWAHWCSLKKGILICYSAPGKLEPLIMVPLEGASLVQLGGGNRKKDLRRAFGLIDSAGSMHILIAGNDSDYFQWIHEMKRSILAFGGDPKHWLNHARVSEDGSADGLSDDGEGSAAPAQQRLLGRTLSKAVQVAKASKQAVVDRRTRRTELKADTPESVEAVPLELPDNPVPQPPSRNIEADDTDNPLSSHQTDDTDAHAPSRRQQLRGKLVGMGQVTKRGLGSAMQMARQKGKAVAEKGREVAERRRQRHQNESFVSESQSTNMVISDSYDTASNTNDYSAISFDTYDASNNDAESSARTEQGDSLHLEQTSPNPVPSESQPLPGMPPDNTSRKSMRERLGNAVKNVRHNNSDPSSVSDRGTGRFARLRRSTAKPNEADGQSGAPEAITLKRVTVEGALVDDTHPFGDDHLEFTEPPQKRLEKSYFVRVKLVNFEKLGSGSDEVLETDTPKTDLQTNHGEEKFPQNQINDTEVETISGDDTQTPAASTTHPGTQRIHVTIETYQRTSAENQGWVKQPSSTVTVPLSAVFALHSEISDYVSQFSPPPCIPTSGYRNQAGGLTQSLASTWGLSSLDTIRITGTLLSGLLQFYPETGDYTLRHISAYHGEAISEFFNSILDCELPVVVLHKIAKFLDLADPSIVDDNAALPEPRSSELGSQLPKAVAQEVFSLSRACRTELFRAIAYTEKVEKIANSCMNEVTPHRDSTQLTSTEPFTPPAFSQRLQESMYSALMKAMEERDLSHAKLAAAEVLHIHELEQQRKLNTRLHAEVEALRMEKNPSDSDQEKKFQRHMQMQQNSDDELMSLCQQLAGEISARTSASLEVDRLKEGRQIDLAQHQNEIRALQEEIASLRKALDEERTQTDLTKNELSKWRRSYEDMVEEELPAST